MIFIIRLAAVITVVLELLKITGVMEISWRYVLLPMAVIIVLYILYLVVLYTFIKMI